MSASVSYMGRRGGMYYGLWVQDSDEILAQAQAGMRILASRSVIIEPSDRGRRGAMYYGLRVQDSDESIAPASACMRILASRSVTIEPL